MNDLSKKEEKIIWMENDRDFADVMPREKFYRNFEELKLKLLLINGPNLNMLGKRDPEQYGNFTLKDAEELSEKTAFERGFDLDCFQSNHEGRIIDKIHEAMDLYDGIIINPGAFTHYSHAIADALELSGLPVAETHISDISEREDFRKISVIARVSAIRVKGMGLLSYKFAVQGLCDYIQRHIKK